MTATSASVNWSLQQVQRQLRLSRQAVSSLLAEGFVVPSRGLRNAFAFSFQDLVLLRTAYGLRQAQVPPRVIHRALAELRKDLPEALPVTGLRVTADSSEVLVRDARLLQASPSEELVLDFRLVPQEGGGIAVLETTMPRTQPAGLEGPSPAELAFQRGEVLEDVDRAAAMDAYREALARDPAHALAAINLGAMLCEDDDCRAAARVFETARSNGAQHPLLAFNHGVVLEELRDAAGALRCYQEALVLDPAFADAHYNAGQLSQRLGDEVGAARYLNAYRRLLRGASHPPGASPAQLEPDSASRSRIDRGA